MKRVRAHFKHSWTSPYAPSRTWQLIVACFEDSKRSPVWPNELAEIRSETGGKLRDGTPIEAAYKLGPVKMRAHYLISHLEPLRMLRYKTAEKHPLKGHATLSFRELPGGRTRCLWSGEYRPKSALSMGSLAWFKLVYEKRFFKRFTRSFQALRLKQDPASSRAA